MAVRKSKAPPAGVATTDDGIPDLSGGESSGEAGASEGKGSAGDEPPAVAPKSEEERIQDNAKRQLATSTESLAGRMKQAESQVSKLTGELKKAEGKATALEKQVSELTAALAAANTAARNSGAVIAGLPENARQLNECVTIASVTDGRGKGGRHQAKAGDVVLVGKESAVTELQEKLGITATVYRVDSDTLADLESSGFLHK